MVNAQSALPAELRGMSLDELRWCIKQANLGKENTKIAKLRLIDQLHYADIAEIIHADRTTVSGRFRAILPLIFAQKTRKNIKHTT